MGFSNCADKIGVSSDPIPILGDEDFLKKIHDQFGMIQEHSISIRDCIEAVSQVFGIQEKLLMSSARSRQPSLAREAVAMLANE